MKANDEQDRHGSEAVYIPSVGAGWIELTCKGHRASPHMIAFQMEVGEFDVAALCRGPTDQG